MQILIPKRKKGKQSRLSKERYQNEVNEFYNQLETINSTLPFKVSSRGWCYILEDHGLMKGDFKTAQDLINSGRKNGLLPLDFTAQDSSRSFSCFQDIDNTTPEQEAESIVEYALAGHSYYKPLNFWDFQHYYIELIVEKVDLKSLFNSICEELYIPIANAKGWSDINLRAEMIQRFKYWQNKGKTPVLLYCGDHDPAGIHISN